MEYLVTARKWRPQRFSEVTGQDHITSTLKNAIKNNRIAHAYLFTGPRGVGKTTTARILAKTLNCLNPADFEPCGKCEICESINSNQLIDIIEIDGASNRGIDEIRTLRESVKYAPAKGKYKVYIIDEVHMLTKESFNAFLKTLEEPPAHTIFIFATTDVHKVPLTIISRCQRFDFRRIQLEAIKSQLKKISVEENINIDDKSLTIIAKKADGALRDAQSFFDQVISFCGNNVEAETVSKLLNLIDDEIYFLTSDAIIDKNFKAVFQVSSEIYENGWNFMDFTEGLIEHFRNILFAIITNSTELIESSEEIKKRYLNYLGKFSEGDLLRILNHLNKIYQEIRYSQNQKLKIEIALTHLIGIEKSDTISEIINKLNEGSSSYSSNATVTKIPAEIKPQFQEKAKKTVSTDKPIKSEEVINPLTQKERNTKNQINESNQGELNFESILQNWQGLVSAINNEKGLTLGPYVSRLKLISLSGNNLSYHLDDPAGQSLLDFNKEYITQKIHEVFGKRLTLQLAPLTQKKPENETEKNLKPKKNTKSTDSQDPYIDLIINELGGESVDY
ncbi:MAG: DNA polymerase III subunit gamma/tau [Ignavibacteriaceae bacterium]|nr:DNA polymerase III subunit gamma/tau [Ignavibacteriaceae bacterium]